MCKQMIDTKYKYLCLIRILETNSVQKLNYLYYIQKIELFVLLRANE